MIKGETCSFHLSLSVGERGCDPVVTMRLLRDQVSGATGS